MANRFAAALSIVLAMPCSLTAQQGVLEVQDLVETEPRPLPFQRVFVDRAGSIMPGATERAWHRVSGEGHLMSLRADEDERSSRAWFTDDSLVATIATLRGSAQRNLSFLRLGSRVLLTTDYPEQLAVSLEQLRAALPPVVHLELRLERLTEEGAQVLLAGTVSFPNGETRTIADVARRGVVFELDAEIATAASTGSPVVGSIAYGASIDARARPLPFHDEAIVELVVRTAMPIAAEPLRFDSDLGELDRIASRVDETGLTLRIARDAQTRHEWIAVDGSRVRLQCRASWEQRAAGAAPSPVTIVCSSLLGPPVLGFASIAASEAQEPRAATEIVPVVEHLRTSFGRDAVPLFEPGGEQGSGLLLLAGNGGEGFQRALDAELTNALRAVDVQVELIDAAAGLEIGDSNLPEGARLVGGFGGPLLASLSACFASAREQSYVRTHEFEVAQASRFPNPVIDIVEDGWFATLRVDGDRNGAPRSASLDLSIAHLDELRVQASRANRHSIGAAPDLSIALPSDQVRIERPIERKLPWRVDIPLDDTGLGLVRRSATTLFGEGRELVVRVRATAP